MFILDLKLKKFDETEENLLLRRIGYNFVPQLRKIDVVSIESQNLYKPLTTPAEISRVGTQETTKNYSASSQL